MTDHHTGKNNTRISQMSGKCNLKTFKKEFLDHALNTLTIIDDTMGLHNQANETMQGNETGCKIGS